MALPLNLKVGGGRLVPQLLQQMRATMAGVSIRFQPLERALLAPLRKTWFTALISACLVGALALPGLVSEQMSEAIINQALDLATPWRGFKWSYLFSQLLAVGALSLALRYWSVRLLGQDFSTLQPAPTMHQKYLAAIWLAPWLSLALAYARAGLDAGAPLGSPFALATVLSLATPALAYFGGRLSGPDRAIAGVNALPFTRWFARSFLPGGFFIAAIAFAFPLCGAWSDVRLAQGLGPLPLFAFALAAFAALGSWALILGRRWRFPIAWAIALTPVLFGYLGWNDNHPVRVLHRESTHSPPMLTLADAAAGWLALPPRSAEDPIILVSAEGGGIRAAYFTAMTLARIADRCPRAANRIFAISGASGGSLGAAIYAAALSARPLDAADQRCDFAHGPDTYQQMIDAVLRRDHLSPIASRFLFSDALQRFIPFPVNALDRQRGLERSLESAFEEVFRSSTLARSFYEIGPSSQTPSVPYLYLNATSSRTGERVMATRIIPLDEEFNYTRSYQDLAPDQDFPLIAMAGASARFPYLSPSGYIAASRPRERLVDGGYFDNSGATTVMEIYHSLTAARKYDQRLGQGPILFLHIGNQPECDLGDERSAKSGTCRRQHVLCDDTRRNCSEPPQPRLDEYFDPLRAVLATRNSRVSYTLAQLQQLPNRSLNGGVYSELFRVQMADRSVPIPLGWYLSGRAAEEMAAQIGSTDNVECMTITAFENACQLDWLGQRLGAVREK